MIEDFDFTYSELILEQQYTDLVAVYGTLRKGMGNHHLLRSAEFLGVQQTEPVWTMYASGFPVIVDGDSSIKIEVYNITKKNLKTLDILEGYPSMYNRKKIKTDWGDAWIYFMKKSELWRNLQLVESGDFVDWFNQR